ncbi:MAG: APC family permease [Bryobacteraceae bacterium]
MLPAGRRSHTNELSKSWEFAGWGTAEHIDDLGDKPVTMNPLDSGPVHKLGQWKATAICGNDITSSCLYVVALCAMYAGPYAPLALAAVAGVLFLFRNIYAEVGSALPLNGGAYNVLLNTTTKAKASIAACLTLLSYLATAVISAYEAMRYAHNLNAGLNVFWATIVLLGFFALLNLIGISESATVAVGLFTFHMTVLSALVLMAGWAVARNPAQLLANWHTPGQYNLPLAIFFGFSAAMLGISGFESSANFIEEQEDGVFPKTLRNMWIAVAFFNPVLSLLAMGLVPVGLMGEHKEDLLAQMGLLCGGTWFRAIVSVDAVLVLSGAVLTAYVGVTGLVRRMTLDRCLPQFLLAENRLRRTNHWIILLFFAVCSSIMISTGGEIEALAGVYTLSFLGVMILFAIGNMLLKVERGRLPRAVRASWGSVIIALIAVALGLIGNLLLNPSYVKIFAIYCFATGLIISGMLLRLEILKVLLAGSNAVVSSIEGVNRRIRIGLVRGIRRLNRFQVIYFVKGDDLPTLNRAVLYVLQNESSRRLRVVHCYARVEDIPSTLIEHLKTVDRIYPRIRIDLLLIKGCFGPELIEKISQRLGVPKNYMFISTPGDHFPHKLGDLGGVRLVM